VAGALGIQLNPGQHWGFYLQGEYIYAPLIDNELGETHDCGGVAITAGMRVGL
jgi:hypothetical protein